MKLTSTSIADGARIGTPYLEPGLGGDNTSPQLSWSPGPDGTGSYAVTCYDPDAPTGSGWWHWIVTDIPAEVTSLPEGGPLPEGAREWRNDYEYLGWGGPWPPPGPAHRYVFTVHALPAARLEADECTPQAKVRAMIHRTELARASLTGLYGVDG